MRLRRTPRGDELLRLSAEIFERLRAGWIAELGAPRVRALEDDLAHMLGTNGGTKLGDLPGWLR